MARSIFAFLALAAFTLANASSSGSKTQESASTQAKEASGSLSAWPAQLVSKLALKAAVAPASPASPDMPSNPIISHAQAMNIVTAAMKKAIEIESPSNIAITDPYGHLIVFLRMDGALLVSVDVALKKAKTVSMFGGKFRTENLYNATSPGGALYGMQQTNNGLIFFGGGVPLKLGNQFVGAIGISGGTVEQDIAIASAAAAAMKNIW